MGPVFSKFVRLHHKSMCALWGFQYQLSSPERRQAMIQKVIDKVIEKEIASDPDAVSPEPGAWPMWPCCFEKEMVDSRTVWSMFDITSGGAPIEQFGVSSQARDIWCELDELEKDFKKRTATISTFAPQFEMMHAEYKIARLHAILDPCIQRTTRFLRSQGHSGELRLRPGYNKGLQLCFKKRERYLIADTTHTLGFVDSGGNIREYLVIMVDNTPEWLKRETLRAYMAIVHQQRKKRGESNCVVYGVHTDTEFFDFLKIDSASKLSSLYNKETSRFWFYPFGQGKDPEAALATRSEESREGYKRLFWNAATQSWRVYMNFTEDVVTLFENILDDGVQDCYGITAI